MFQLILKKHYPLIIFVCAYLLFGLFMFRRLPVTNDEEYRYSRGADLLHHFTSDNLNQFKILNQPNVNNFVYSGYTVVLNLFIPGLYYDYFHLLNFIFALPIFIVVYLLVYDFSKNKFVATGACLSLALFPGFSGHIGINTEDIPFAISYLIAIYAIIHLSVGNLSANNVVSRDTPAFSSKRTLPRIFLLGLLFGFSQSLRQVGFTLYIILVAHDVFYFKGNIRAVLQRMWEYFFIFVIANFFMVITWPNFAINYFRNMYLYLVLGKDYSLWNHQILFMGQLIDKYQRPFYYLPLLQLITYPVYILLFFILSLFLAKRLLKNRTYFVLFFTFMLNYLMYFLLKPVIYDGIRHYLFLAPILVIMASICFIEFISLVKNIWVKRFTFVIVLLGFALSAYKTFVMFPYEYFYFNELSRVFGNPYVQFDSDYFAATYKDAALWIRDTYVANMIPAIKPTVYSCDGAFEVSYYSKGKFYITTNRAKADLIICDYKSMLTRNYTGDIIHKVVVDDNILNFVLKVTPTK